MSAMMFADSMLGASAEMIRPRPSEANTKNAADTARNPTLPRSGMRKNPSADERDHHHVDEREQRPRQELRDHELAAAAAGSPSSAPACPGRARAPSVTAVCCTVTIMMMTTMRPGIRKSADLRSGLYQVRTRGSSRPSCVVSRPCRSAHSTRISLP